MKLQKTHVYLVHTIHKHLFFMRQNACEMGALQTAFPFSCIPRTSMGKVLVALPLKFVPAIVTCLRVWEETRQGLIKLIYVIQTWFTHPKVHRRPKPISTQCPRSKGFTNFGHDDKKIMIKRALTIPAKWVAIHLRTGKALSNCSFLDESQFQQEKNWKRGHSKPP